MSDGIMLQMNAEGEWTKYEEPYATIEIKTEEDYKELIELIELGKKAKEDED